MIYRHLLKKFITLIRLDYWQVVLALGNLPLLTQPINFVANTFNNLFWIDLQTSEKV